MIATEILNLQTWKWAQILKFHGKYSHHVDTKTVLIFVIVFESFISTIEFSHELNLNWTNLRSPKNNEKSYEK